MTDELQNGLPESHFGITVEELRTLMEVRGKEGLQKIHQSHSSIDHIAEKLHSHVQDGLTLPERDPGAHEVILSSNKLLPFHLQVLWAAHTDALLISKIHLIMGTSIQVGFSL
ncbi:unnamed protein product, partial [Meganyctiphanes norvegica]